jgi:ubiquinone/menaquinone biosynthesis C-methylase UbiE
MWLFLVQKGMNMEVGTGNKAARVAWVKRVVGEVPAGARILDAGAGELLYKPFCDHLEYVSQDFSNYDGKGDGAALQTESWDSTKVDIVSDITAIPEADASFDAIMCIEVFEHLPEPPAALREFTRLLKPGGALILTAPFCALSHFSPYFYCTGFSRNFYEYWLEKLGYEILELKYNGNYFEYLAQELRRLGTVGEKYASVRPAWLERKAIKHVLRFLDRLSKRDRGSNELLAYGLHILARKSNPKVDHLDSSTFPTSA